MGRLDFDPKAAISRLEAALGSQAVPAKEARACQRLVEQLRHPVRIGVIGPEGGGGEDVLRSLLGADPLPAGHPWPTLELRHGTAPATDAVLEDGTRISENSLPGRALMAERPVFLTVTAPYEILRGMSFLHLALGDHPEDQRSALDWAASRTEIAIWVSRDYGAAEAATWTLAPDALRNHALLVATAAGIDETDLSARAGFDFDGVFAARDGHAPAALLDRLESDIRAAQEADFDAAQLFLHRFGHLVETLEAEESTGKDAAIPQPAPPPVPPKVPLPDPMPSPLPDGDMSRAPAETTAAPEPAPELAPEPFTEPAPAPAPRAAEPDRTPPSPELLSELSEPFLYLKRRARALLEMLEWQDPEAQDWPGTVLGHCAETCEELQSRAANWNDDLPGVPMLRRAIDEAGDLAVLMRIEGGADEAADAAVLLLQLRGEFERELAA
ncbi:hypothetical protein HKCCE2091_14460 [Rhodobacterales bacterium HKCCE2091]|nr:hypothetical protein [Rhodobacterales bacterium HKCCE2091]